jgi:hypothetical protein
MEWKFRISILSEKGFFNRVIKPAKPLSRQHFPCGEARAG